MPCLDNKMKKTSTTNSQTTSLLKKEGLALSKNNLPVHSLFDLFRCLTKRHKKRTKSLLTKIKIFVNFTVLKINANIQKSLKDSIVTNYDDLITNLEDENLVFDGLLLQIFCLLFSLHVKLFVFHKTSLSRQSFGSANNPSTHILFEEGTFFILKKRLRSPLLLSPVTRITNKTLINVKSEKLETKAIQLQKQNNTSKNQLSPQKLKRNKLKYKKQDSSLGFKQMATKSTLESINVDESQIEQNKRKVINQKTSNGSLMNKNIGRLKFFNPIKEYGFIVLKDGTDVFVHKTDLLRSRVDVGRLYEQCQTFEVYMAFDIEYYPGKNKMHKKAVKLRTVMLQTPNHY